MKVFIEGKKVEIKARELKKSLKKFEGEMINKWWSWYNGGDFSVKYQLHRVEKKIIIICHQNGKRWQIELTTKEFLSGINYYSAPKEIRKILKFDTVDKKSKKQKEIKKEREDFIDLWLRFFEHFK